MSSCSRRWVASLEAGAITRATSMASSSGCNSLGAEPNQDDAPEPARRAQHRGHVAVRQGALDGEDLLDAGYGHAAAQQHLQALDHLIGQARQIGQGALADLAVLAVGLAQQHRGGRVAVGHGLDVHDFIYRSDTVGNSRQ